MHLAESGEMYLETILRLSEKCEVVRSIDISEAMGYSKPSISRAVNLLRDEGYIEINPQGHISLLEKGRAVAEKIYDRHITLTAMLINLGVDEETAQEDACKLEHVFSDKSFAAVKKHLIAQGSLKEDPMERFHREK